MTVVLFAPIGLGLRSWELVDGLPADSVAVEYPATGEGYPSLAEMADTIASALDGPLDVIGMSMGGVVAQHLASRHPGRVRSLVLGCCPAEVDPDAMASRSRTALTQGMGELTTQTMPRWFAGYDDTTETRPAVLLVRDTLLAADPTSFAGAMAAIAPHRLRDIDPITAPTTIIAGRDDPAAPIDKALGLFDLIPNSHIDVVPGGHLPQVEHPAEYASALRRHFDWVAHPRPRTRLSAPRQADGRVPFPQQVDPPIADLLRDINGHRGQRLRIYETLAHSRTLVGLVSSLARYFIDESALPARVREIGILRIAAVVGSEYEYAQHVPRARAAGLTEDEITGLVHGSAAWPEADAAVIAMADELLAEGGVADGTWRRLRALLPQDQLVDLVVLLGYYVLIAGTTNTLRVPLEPDAARWPSVPAPAVLRLGARERSVRA
ncbi:MAG TPA: alpha/beta fold hydrolase [Pseudonocardiaceae bacterium]|nr:alpha/beta fold hydrolase [Pseudonocardiaceae bacterium]